MDEHSGAGKHAPTRFGLVAACLMLLLGTSQAWITRTANAANGSTGTFGKTNVGGSVDRGLFADVKLAYSATLSVQGSVTKLSVYATPGVNSPSPQLLRALIYSDSGGSPGALVATGPIVTYRGDINGTGWFDLPFGSPVALSPGTYWLGFITGNTAQGMGYAYDSVPKSRAYNANTYASGPSNPFGSVTMDAEQASIYATYTPTTGGESLGTLRLGAPPSASFRWFPASPNPGEPVSLVSTSTDATSPIAAYAWDMAGNGPFTSGGLVLITSFSTPGRHIVRLRVSDVNGLSSVATEAIAVGSPPLAPMQPFPIVRIAGSDYSSGVKLNVLSVLAPIGALTTVSCQGRRCPATAESRVSVSTGSSRNTGVAVSSFRRFERLLRAGVTLQIRVSKPGTIGKYTRFTIRRGRLPVRVDACLSSTNPKPVVCPWS